METDREVWRSKSLSSDAQVEELSAEVGSQDNQIKELMKNSKLIDKHRLEKVRATCTVVAEMV